MQYSWRQILAWKVYPEPYSFEDMLPMLEGGQVWKAVHSHTDHAYLYVGDTSIEKDVIEEGVVVGVYLNRGIWRPTSTEVVDYADLMRVCIWKSEELFELLDRNWFTRVESF